MFYNIKIDYIRSLKSFKLKKYIDIRRDRTL